MIGLDAFLPGFLAAYAILFVAASSPGPAVALLLGTALDRGRAPALLTAVGIAMGSVVLNLLTLAGVSLLLQQTAWGMTVIRALGATYLLYLAVMAFRKSASPPPITAVTPVARSGLRLFLAGFLLQVTNPKAIVFWLAIAAIGATAGGGPLVIALFVLGAFLISFGCHGAWALLLSSAPVRRAYARSRRWVEFTLGAFFLYAAWRLATART